MNQLSTKYSSYSKDITLNINELKELLSDQKNMEKNINKIDNQIEILNGLFNAIKSEAINLSLLITNEYHRNFLEIIGTWIQRNYNSSRLISILSLVSLSFSFYDHNINISI